MLNAGNRLGRRGSGVQIAPPRPNTTEIDQLSNGAISYCPSFSNTALNLNMSNQDAQVMILLHELGHEPNDGNRPPDGQFDVRQYDIDIYNNCIK